MKRIAGLVLAVIVLQIGFAPPSHAIFGLSQCEKMWDSINSEESIGYELWLRYRAEAKRVDAIDSPSQRLWGSVWFQIAPVIESDIKRSKIAAKNPDCFSARANANIRLTLRDSTESLAMVKQVLKASANYSKDVYLWNTKAKWSSQYPKYVRIRDWAN